jgi:hypothetical protein
MHYGQEWRQSRALAHTALNVNAVKKYHYMQEDVAALFARDLLDEPEQFRKFARK